MVSGAFAASKSVINALISAKGNYAEAKKMVARCMKSEDYVEGRRAFMEKRAPAFMGK
jgi:enoyl-CoA hydratase/carnithine racemase